MAGCGRTSFAPTGASDPWNEPAPRVPRRATESPRRSTRGYIPTPLSGLSNGDAKNHLTIRSAWYDGAMNTSSNSAVLDELIEPVARCFTPEVARRILSLRASPELQAKLDELADKCGEGTLTPEEHQRYDAYVRGLNFIGILQANARAQLNADSPA